MSGISVRTRRLGRRLGLTRNQLCDRLERVAGMLRLLTALAVVLVIAGSALVGLTAYRGSASRAAIQRAAEHQVEVTLEETAAVGWMGMSSRKPKPSEGVLARWSTATDPAHTGRVFPSRAAAAGERIKVWMDAEGRPVPPPADTAEVVIGGLTYGLVAVPLSGFALLGLVYFGRYRLGRTRRDRIAAEWAEIEPHWTQRSWRDGGDQPQGPLR